MCRQTAIPLLEIRPRAPAHRSTRSTHARTYASALNFALSISNLRKPSIEAMSGIANAKSARALT